MDDQTELAMIDSMLDALLAEYKDLRARGVDIEVVGKCEKYALEAKALVALCKKNNGRVFA